MYETIFWETELPLLSFIPHHAVACSTPESCCTSTDTDSRVCQGWDCQHERAGVLETEIDKVWEKYQHSNASLPADPLWVPFSEFIITFRGGKPSLSISHSNNTGNMRTGSSWSDNTRVSKYWRKLQKKTSKTSRQQQSYFSSVLQPSIWICKAKAAFYLFT